MKYWGTNCNLIRISSPIFLLVFSRGLSLLFLHSKILRNYYQNVNLPIFMYVDLVPQYFVKIENQVVVKKIMPFAKIKISFYKCLNNI